MAVMERAGLHNVTLDAAESIASGQHHFSFMSGDSKKEAWLFDQSYCSLIAFGDGSFEHVFNIEKTLGATGISRQQVQIVTSSKRRCALLSKLRQVRCPAYDAEAVGSGQDRALLNVKESLAIVLDSTPGQAPGISIHDSSSEEGAPTVADTIHMCAVAVPVMNTSKNTLRASPSNPFADLSGGGSPKAAKRRRRRKARAAQKTSSDARATAFS